jgi:hypothetical protein
VSAGTKQIPKVRIKLPSDPEAENRWVAPHASGQDRNVAVCNRFKVGCEIASKHIAKGGPFYGRDPLEKASNLFGFCGYALI